MSDKISSTVCRQRLARVWFIATGFLFAILVIQSIGGKKYGDDVAQAWEWFLPNIVPTLSLIIGVLVLSATRGVPDRQVDRYMFRLSMGLSIAYLVTVSLTILAQPLVAMPALELMRTSNLWLAPFQGLVAAALGAFFSAGD